MSKLKILVLDDDDELRYNLYLFLQDEGYDCQQASNCMEALELLEKEKFSIAIVDIRLPGMSGDEFIPIACGIDPDLSYIIYTGSAEFDLRSELTDCGLESGDVLMKPVLDMTKFTKKIEELVKRKR